MYWVDLNISKAENIYCTPDSCGNLKEVVVADFDTAKRTQGTTALSTIGTLGYMAPEVFDNSNVEGSYSFSADSLYPFLCFVVC